MSVHGMREGDKICGSDGRVWRVDEINGDQAMTTESNDLRPENKRRKKSFSGDTLFPVDIDDGIWQEIG